MLIICFARIQCSRMRIDCSCNFLKRFISPAAVTNARFAPFRGTAGRSLHPLDRARSTSQIRALVTSEHPQCAAKRGGLPSAARRRTLRSGFISLCASFRPLLHWLTCPARRHADRRPRTSGHKPAGNWMFIPELIVQPQNLLGNRRI